MQVMQLTYSSIFANDTTYKPMSNKRLTKQLIPQSVFEYRDLLVSDFFNFYEMRYDNVKVLKVIEQNKPTQTPTPEQMAHVLNAAIIYWKGFITQNKLPNTLIKTLEIQIKKQWESLEASQNQGISKRRRKSLPSKNMTGMSDSSTN